MVDGTVRVPFLELLVRGGFNERRIAGFPVVANPVFLASFPRSGNGWLRTLVAALLLRRHGVDLSGAFSTSVTEPGSEVEFSAIQCGARVYNVEGLLPDIYYLKANVGVFEQYSKTFPLVPNIVKTHHVAPCGRFRCLAVKVSEIFHVESTRLFKYVILVREPIHCIASTYLLFFGNTMSMDDVAVRVAYIAARYKEYVGAWTTLLARDRRSRFLLVPHESSGLGYSRGSSKNSAILPNRGVIGRRSGRRSVLSIPERGRAEV